MKKIIFCVFTLLVTISKSQITITYNDLPQPGDTFVYYVDNNPNIVITPGNSIHQTWDYSSLNNDSIKFAAFGFTSNLPFANSFPTSNLYTYGPAAIYAGPGNPVNYYGYYMLQTNNSGLYFVGMRANYDGTGEKNINLDQPELIMGTPCTYSSDFTNHASWKAWINNNPADYDTLFKRNIYKTLTADAYGTLKTPYGTFSNVIRIKEISIIEDSVYGFFNGIQFVSMLYGKDTIRTYHFWTTGARTPVCRIFVNYNNIPTTAEFLAISLINNDTITSVMDGNWSNPSTWDCSCVPTPGKNIVINHNVTLDTDFGWYTGSVIIKENSSLMEDIPGRNFAAYGGTFNNSGIFSVTNFATSNVIVTNSGTMENIVRFYNTSVINNSGIIMSVDSLFNSGDIYNTSTANTHAINIYNTGNIYNNAHINSIKIANSGYFENTSAILANLFINLGAWNNFNNGSLNIQENMLNMGFFVNYPYATIQIVNNFANNDSIYHDALFINDGYVLIYGNFFNEDTIKGFGQFCVNNLSVNKGVMMGTFDFCDATPPSVAPFIDFNLGTIDQNITWCSYPCGTHVKNLVNNDINVFPIPAEQFVNISFNKLLSNANIYIYDFTGKLVKSFEIKNKTNITIEKLTPGIYNCILISNSENIKFKIIFN